jgi:hypothetical protein
MSQNGESARIRLYVSSEFKIGAVMRYEIERENNGTYRIIDHRRNDQVAVWEDTVQVRLSFGLASALVGYMNAKDRHDTAFGREPERDRLAQASSH